MFGWGPTLATLWVLPGPVDSPLPIPKPHLGFAESDSGFRDTWVGTDQHTLQIEARQVPSITANGVTGYSSVNGVYDALLYMQKNGGRYYPNKLVTGTYHDIYLLEYEVQRDGQGARYRIKMTLRDAGGNPFRSY